MADGGGKGRTKAGGSAPEPALDLPSGHVYDAPLPGNLPPEMFTGPGLLALADLLPVMTAYYDRDVRIQFINKLFADWLEVPRSKLIGKTMEDVLGQEAFEARRPMVEAALAGEHQFFVADLQHSSRGPLVAQSEYVPWVRPAADGTPEVIGFVAVVKDVTEQRVAERALKESEARFRRIANSAPAMMWVTRLDRVRDFVNEAYADFACGPGCSHEEARTLDWRGGVPSHDAGPVAGGRMARGS